ncbi:MAG: hypothetical protein M5R40_25355 [Anaerolineae bacterium]|nr:hypothetical protein [Anaerolineae bacterium]
MPLPNRQAFSERIGELVANNQVRVALEEIEIVLNQLQDYPSAGSISELRNERSTLSKRFTQIGQDYRLGILTYQERTVAENKIVTALLELRDDIVERLERALSVSGQPPTDPQPMNHAGEQRPGPSPTEHPQPVPAAPKLNVVVLNRVLLLVVLGMSFSLLIYHAQGLADAIIAAIGAVIALAVYLFRRERDVLVGRLLGAPVSLIALLIALFVLFALWFLTLTTLNEQPPQPTATRPVSTSAVTPTTALATPNSDNQPVSNAE